MLLADEMVAWVRQAFGWTEDVVVSQGPRGALGQIWRLDVGPARYALKEIFAEPPTETLIAAEVTFGQRATQAGVRLPRCHPDLDGRYLLTAPDGRWLRLYDWIDLRPVDLTAPATPRQLGTLFARLHQCSPTTTAEPDGRPPSPWYHHLPAQHQWSRVPTQDTPWAARLAHRLTTLPDLCTAVTPPDPAALIVCHRDLHPANILTDPHGTPVIVDWDNLGPATPDRELAQALFDWFCDGPQADLDAMHTMYHTYISQGGPGRITQPEDFSMLLASRLNFLLLQLNVATDPDTEPRHREWAEHEIDEALRILPTPQHLSEVLKLARHR